VSEKIRRKFPGIVIPSTIDIHEINKKVKSIVSLLDKKPA